MENYQFWCLIGLLVGGFGWVIHQVRDIDKRMSGLETHITVIETILSVMGMPIRDKK